MVKKAKVIKVIKEVIKELKNWLVSKEFKIVLVVILGIRIGNYFLGEEGYYIFGILGLISLGIYIFERIIRKQPPFEGWALGLFGIFWGWLILLWETARVPKEVLLGKIGRVFGGTFFSLVIFALTVLLVEKFLFSKIFRNNKEI